MARWEPAAAERLQKAALELFQANGFDDTTVADIAAAAGLTERTFYRYFADKREVIFGGQELFQQAFVDAIAAAPEDAQPLDIVAFAISAVCAPDGLFSEDRRPYSRMRTAVIAHNPDLRERELLKMASLSVVLADALRQRGVAEPAASLAAESGVVVFRASFARWIDAAEVKTIAEIEREMFGALRALSV